MSSNPFDLAFSGFAAEQPRAELEAAGQKVEPPAKLISEPGAYPEISAEQYHGVEICDSPSISATGLKLIEERCPAHYWERSPLNPNRKPQPSKRHFRIGHLLHDILCEGERPAGYHIVPDGFVATHWNKWADEIPGYKAAIAAGHVAMHRSDFELACRMAESIDRHELAGALLRSGKPEVTLAAKDPKTGRWLRTRPDVLPDTMDVIPDIKTTVNAQPDAFCASATRFGYFMAAAHYLDVIDLVYGEAKRSFVLITVEKEPPYLVTLYAVDEGDIHEARMLNRRALNKFDECLRTGDWHGYATDDQPILPLLLTEWKRKQINLAVERGLLSYDS